MILGILGALSFSSQKAIAEDNSSEQGGSPQVDITIEATGTTSGTLATLDRSIYHSGDEIIVNWKGVAVGDDFIIPTAIKVDGVTKVSMSQLNKVDSVQTSNVQYKRRVGGDGTLTTYDSLKSYLTSEHQVSVGIASVASNVEVQYTRVSPVYRMYNMITSEHLFSTNKQEYDGWVEKCALDQDYWIGEGIDWLAPTSSSNTKTVHRLYNESLGAMGKSSHYYTADSEEMESLISNYGWVDDGEANWFMSGGSTPIYTCYNEALGSAHHYTSSKSEWQGLSAHGWALEEDKNGTNPPKTPEGVFQCTMATNWSFSPNYYTVEHRVENADNSYSVKETQVVSGIEKNKTQAVANSYPGYVAGDITNKIISGNTTVVQINYSRMQYSVTFDGNGVTLSGQTSKVVKFGDKIPAVTTPNPTGGREFKGWFYDRACTKSFSFDHSTMPSGNLTLYAGWTSGNDGDNVDKDKVKVTFYLHGLGQTITKEIAKGSTIEKIADPTFDGYTFGGWYTDLTYATEFDFASSINQDTTIYAKWISNSSDASNIYYVTFDYQGKGGSNTTLSVFEGKQVPSLANPTHSGYRFDGWYKSTNFAEADRYDFSTPITSSFTLYAKWVETSIEPVVEDVTIILNYMEKDTNVTIKDSFGVPVSNLNVTLHGIGNAVPVATLSSNADGFVEFTYYCVNLHLNGGSGAESLAVYNGAIPSKPNNPVKTGWNFIGWYRDQNLSESFDFTDAITSNLELYAKWQNANVTDGYWLAPANAADPEAELN